MDPPPPPFRLADPSRFRAELTDAGLTDVQVETVTWNETFTSAAHFWDVVTSGKPISVQLSNGLTDEQRTDVRHVLDGMFRERSGGRPDVALRTEMNIGTGTVTSRLLGGDHDHNRNLRIPTPDPPCSPSLRWPSPRADLEAMRVQSAPPGAGDGPMDRPGRVASAGQQYGGYGQGGRDSSARPAKTSAGKNRYGAEHGVWTMP